MKEFLPYVLMAFLAPVTAVASEKPPIQVPYGAVVTIDGQRGDAEWSDAAIASGSGVEISFLSTDGLLQIGVRSSPLFVASVCVERGNEVHVFHASSALGHAVYVREDDSEEWTLSRDFEWRLRKKEIEADVAGAQDEHRSAHGWVANTIEMEDPDAAVEFQIDAAFFADSPARVAVGLLLRGESPSLGGWPLGPDEDACTTQEVVAGPLPDRASFDPSRWTPIKVDR